MTLDWQRVWKLVRERGVFVWFKVRLGKKRYDEADKKSKKEERMKRFPFMILFAMLAAPAHAGYRLSLPTKVNPYVVGARDLHNGAWMTGTSLEALWWLREGDQQPIAYLAVNHLYEIADKAMGSLGLTVGLNTGKAGETIARLAPILLPEQSRRLKWLQTVSNWVSLEVGGGYRAFGPAPSRSRWYYTAGGRVRVPIEKLWSK